MIGEVIDILDLLSWTCAEVIDILDLPSWTCAEAIDILNPGSWTCAPAVLLKPRELLSQAHDPHHNERAHQ